MNNMKAKDYINPNDQLLCSMEDMVRIFQSIKDIVESEKKTNKLINEHTYYKN